MILIIVFAQAICSYILVGIINLYCIYGTYVSQIGLYPFTCIA